VAMYTEEAEEALLGGHPDFVLDAIDNINTKVSSSVLPYRLVLGTRARGMHVSVRNPSHLSSSATSMVGRAVLQHTAHPPIADADCRVLLLVAASPSYQSAPA